VKFASALLLALLSGGVHAQSINWVGGGQAAQGHSLSVTANLSSLGATIPSSFIGFSADTTDFINGFYQGTTGSWSSAGFTGNAASFISLAQLVLGSGCTFRLGGSDSDAGTPPTVTSGMANNLNSFLGAIGCPTLIYGLDLVANNSAAAATTAGTLATAIGTANVVFQFGNEPSLESITAANYVTRWNAYYTAVTGTVGGAKLAATDDIINPGWGSVPTVISQLTPGLAGLTMVTEHWYPFCNGMFSSPVPAILLSQIQMQQFTTGGLSPGSTGQYLINTQAYGATPQRMTETNSICSRGQAGMSDRMMASAWFINTAIVLANQGWAGMNPFQVWFGGIGNYNPTVITADNNFAPSPVFYGMFLFAKIQGQQTAALAYANSGTNIVGIATKGGNGNANILVVNNDVLNPVSVKPDQSSAWTTAKVLLVNDSDGNGCASSVPFVGGAAIGESGAWTGGPTTINSGASVTIPPCGAALIQIQP
jgi:hypothetical protein